jgi:alcohol dehydrogenase class IV
MQFEFSTAGRIIFGCGISAEVPKIAVNYGTHVLLVAGHSVLSLPQFIESLKDKNLHVTLYRTQGEPTVSTINNGKTQIKENKCDLVIGFGGGSTLDTAKAIAAMATNPGELLDYLEVIGQGKPLDFSPLPIIAIPTTSGTGSEVTRNAVIGSPEHQVKVSLRSSQMIPRIAVVDPELTYSVPKNITASTGMDALTQLIEPYTSNFSNPMTDSFCIEGIRRVSTSLVRAYKDGSDKKARVDMSLASLYGGLALTNAKLGAVHGFAGAIGGLFPISHGVICAALLPHVVEGNIEALKNKSSHQPYLKRYEMVAEILTNNPHAIFEDGIIYLKTLIEDLNIPTLAAFGITTNDFPAIIEKARNSSSMKGNPIELSEADMFVILNNAL